LTGKQEQHRNTYPPVADHDLDNASGANRWQGERLLKDTEVAGVPEFQNGTARLWMVGWHSIRRQYLPTPVTPDF
jgi:hypothetical protein